MQIKITNQCCFTPVEMANTKKTKNSASKDVKKRELLYTAGANTI